MCNRNDYTNNDLVMILELSIRLFMDSKISLKRVKKKFKIYGEFSYACEWYNLPKKSSKLLATMMMRTTIPCRLTGAKLFPLSMESFSKVRCCYRLDLQLRIRVRITYL